MSIDTSIDTTNASTAPLPQGLRKNGKSWHVRKRAFRPLCNQTSYAKRRAQLACTQATKAVEREMKAEKAAERERRVQMIRDRRRAKEEKERYERMGEKMHARVVERRRRREKRNKLLGK